MAEAAQRSDDDPAGCEHYRRRFLPSLRADCVLCARSRESARQRAAEHAYDRGGHPSAIAPGV